MQASLCLRAPQLSLTLHRQRSTLQCQFAYEKYFLALRRRRQTTSSHGALRATVRSQTPSSDPAPPSHERSRTLAAVASAAVVTVALASAMACICPSWSGRGRIGLAAPWHKINITIGEERGRAECKRDIKREKLKKQIAMRQRAVADQLLHEMFEKTDLPAKFYEITPNYPKIKDYFEHHLRLSDEACETLIRSWKKIKPGPDQIDIGLLLVDLCIIKGNLAEAIEINEKIIKNASEIDPRPVIRSAIINMIKDRDEKKGENKTEWENFAKKIKDIESSSFINEPVEEP